MDSMAFALSSHSSDNIPAPLETHTEWTREAWLSCLSANSWGKSHPNDVQQQRRRKRTANETDLILYCWESYGQTIIGEDAFGSRVAHNAVSSLGTTLGIRVCSPCFPMKATNWNHWTHFSVGTMLCCDFISLSRYHRHLPWTLLRLFSRSCSGEMGRKKKITDTLVPSNQL